MAKVIDINKHRNKVKKHEACEWDVIADIFSKTLNNKNLSKEQVNGIIKDIEKECKNKFENNTND